MPILKNLLDKISSMDWLIHEITQLTPIPEPCWRCRLYKSEPYTLTDLSYGATLEDALLSVIDLTIDAKPVDFIAQVRRERDSVEAEELEVRSLFASLKAPPKTIRRIEDEAT